MQNVAILGLGLMGGSLGLALKRKRPSARVLGYARRAEVREAALREGIIDEAFDDPAQAVASADLVVIGTPIYTMEEMLERCRPSLKEGAVVTDVGSTKSHLHAVLEPMLEGTGALFIGSHPICGSEKQGLEAARADLYEGAVVVLTTGKEADSANLKNVEAFWEELGAVTCVLDADEHDRMMARTSHLPHLAAVLLALTVGRDEDLEKTGFFCGTGYRDTARKAGGSPTVWYDIVRSNREAILGELEALREALDSFERVVKEGAPEELRERLEKARRLHAGLIQYTRIEDD